MRASCIILERVEGGVLVRGKLVKTGPPRMALAKAKCGNCRHCEERSNLRNRAPQ